MQIIGFLLAFSLALFLISKKINMGVSLLIAALITGIFSTLAIKELPAVIIFDGIFSYMSIQLMIIVGLISGLGYIMKKTGDLQLMIVSLNSLVKNIKILTMLVPALIGTLNVPGGAILSAPMIEESGDRINLSNVNKNSINLFFRHIGFFIYPLYPSMILISELLNVNMTGVISYTFFVMLAGIAAAYLTMFRNIDNGQIPVEERKKTITSIKGFFSGFFSILVILVLALLLNVPFHYAIIIGVIVALLKNIEKDNYIAHLKNRITGFFTQGIDYQLVFTIAGLMAFKAVIEATGLVDDLALYIIEFGIPLPLMVCVLGLFAGYVSGVHVAATGMLAPLFAPMIPDASLAVYAALLFTTINLGYLISPLHLCLALGNEYFDVAIGPVYKKLFIPVTVMVFTSLILVWFFA